MNNMFCFVDMYICIGELRRVQELLSKSEAERLELREKYIQIGNKVESLLMTEAIESDEVRSIYVYIILLYVIS
jgi:hypothetical protein